MDWNRTKTIFIIAFLVLNLFLTWQLIVTKNESQLSVITEATIQERLKQNNVKIEVELPEEEISGTHVIGKSIEMTERIAKNLFNQETQIIEDHLLISVLNQPYDIDLENNFRSQLHEFLSTYVYKGDQYRFGRYVHETDKIYLYQQYNEKVAYTGGIEPLILQLNDQDEIISYQQVYMQFEELDDKESEVLSSLKAIEVLLNNQLIGIGNTITEVEFGYYSFFSPQGDTQMFAPMWRIVVDERDYLVNAIEGTIQQLN